jgi:hypothetical protein
MGPLAGACALSVAAWGCAPEGEALDGAPASPPAAAAAVLEVDGLPLTLAELEPLERDILALYPEYSRKHARRLALTNEFLPRLAAHAANPELWRRARAACEGLATAGLGTAEALHVEGDFRALGLGLWSAARRLPPEQWSAPVELTGRWARIRVTRREVAADPLGERLALALIEFPYVDPENAAAALEAAIDRAHLRVLDPTLEDVLPEAWKHRMRGPR